MVLEHFPLAQMASLISSIDPIVAVYLIIGALGSIFAITMMKLYVPDSERYPKHR